MADITNDESEDESFNYKSQSTKKKRLASSSSSDGEICENKKTPSNCTDTNATSRSSERIRRKRNKSFTMPSKQDVWSAIPSTKTPEKIYDGLKPRKLVNNFTRVTHRYNHDPAYTSDEDSSLGGFMVEDGTESSSDSSDSDFLDENVLENEIRTRKRKHRIKNRRIVQLSSDSDSVPKQSGGQAEVRSRLREKILSRSNSVDETASGQTLENDKMAAKDDLITFGLNKAKTLLASSSDDEKPEDNKLVSGRRPVRDKRGRKRKANTCMTSGTQGKSSSDADDEECTSMSDISVSKPKCEDVSVVNECDEPRESSTVVSVDTGSDSERVTASKRRRSALDTVSVDTGSDSEGVTASKRRRSALDTGSESSDQSSGSDDEDEGEKNTNCLSRGFLQSQERKQKRENLFKDFKQARSKLISKQTMQ